MPDLSDAFGWIRKLIYRVDRIESGALLENASITSGRMRFIGGLLRIDSGGRVEIVGTLQVDGTSTVTGSFTVEGPWALAGNGTITGAVSIEGPVTISGNVDLTGLMNVTGDIVVDGTGSIRVEGTGNIEVTGTGGIIVSGDGSIKVQGTGSIEVTGSGGIVVSEEGKITAGNVVLDPSSNGGSLKFVSGPEVYADDDELSLYTGTLTNITMNGTQVFISGPGIPDITIDGDGIRFSGVDPATSTDGLNWLAVETATGYLRRVAPGIVGSSRVDLQACKLEYSIVSPK